jgi:membrane protein DedA with SNARE-associated domain
MDTFLAGLTNPNLLLGPNGLYIAFLILIAKEIGFPVPIPSDLLVVLVGAGAAGAGVSVIFVIAVLLVASVAGSLAHLFLTRGPARALLIRIGPKLGLSQDKINALSERFRRVGWPGIAVSRVLPGLRAIAVTACGIAGLPLSLVLPGVLVGSFAFVLLHVLIGYLGGPLALNALQSINIPLLPAFVALALLGLVGWFILKRRSRTSEKIAGWSECACPVCLALVSADPFHLSSTVKS